MKTALRILAAAAALSLAACHPFDERQVPVIQVGGGLQPVISWSPSPAYELRVYAGDKDGDLSEVIDVQGVMPLRRHWSPARPTPSRYSARTTKAAATASPAGATATSAG